MEEKYSDYKKTAISKSNWKKGDILLNRFEIKNIFETQMSIVYIADDRDWQMPFAIKTFRDEYLWNETAIKRFLREAEIWINLERHTNIVFANYVQKIEGKPYIFLEYIEGGDLTSWIGKLDIPQALDFAIQFCTGMNYANKKLRTIHRDIKPGNVMIAKAPEFAHGYAVKVTDFGLAVSVFGDILNHSTEEKVIPEDVRLTKVGAIMGTVPYMSKEQFSDIRSVDIRSDIYSFGVMFYEMLTGKRPFKGPSFEDYKYQHTYLVPESPNTSIEAIDLIVERCLKKHPDERYYHSFHEIKEELIKIYESIAPGKRYIARGGVEELTAIDWDNKGNSLTSLGKFNEAIECFNKSLTTGSVLPERTWSSKGICLYNLGEFNEATTCYDKAIEQNSRYAAAWVNKGNSLSGLGKFDEAITCFNQALKINPRLAEAWSNKGVTLEKCAKYKEALECYDEALMINPRYFEAWNNRGYTLAYLLRFKESIDCYDKALKIEPKSSHTWSNKGASLAKLEKFEEAVICFDMALEINPNDDKLWFNKGFSLMKLSQFNEAIRCYDKALEINSNLAEAWASKGLTLWVINKTDEALSYFDKALQINPNFQQAREWRRSCWESLNR